MNTELLSYPSSDVVEVKFHYDAERPDELTLHVGDIIKNCKLVEHGWLKGELNGKQGVFPANFVVKKAPPDATAVAAKKTAKVVFNYDATLADELTIKKGDIVEVVGEEEPGWIKVKLRDKIGVIPYKYVKIIRKKPLKLPTSSLPFCKEPPPKPPKYSPSTTPLATKKSSAKLNSIFEFDSDEDDLFRASSAKLNSIFEFDSDEDDLFRASNVGSKHNLKPPTYSPSTTPLATKKPSAKLNSIFKLDSDEDDFFRASNVGSKHNSKPPTYSPSTTPLATKKPSAKLNSIFKLDSDEDDFFRASNVGSKHNSKPPTYSPSTTPLATKKPSAKLNSIFKLDSDEDDLFRASNVRSKHNSAQQTSKDQQSTSSIRLSQSSTGSTSRGEANLSEIAQIHKDLQALENQISQLGGDINTTVQRLHQSVDEIERKYENLQTQMSYNQQETENSIKRMVANVDNAFRKALDVQKSNEELQESNAHLRNQLSLTQQQLLGIQSMMSCSRAWVVSHDQFKIGKEISRGAWATVHETTFRGATVAAKCLHQLITAPTTRQLFQREMEMALQCHHQNIVTFLGATLEGPPVILMELMDTSLRNAYEHGNIKDHQVLGIFYDIASALHFLHTRPDPVIHRDVSSANVLLKALYSGEWLAKLGDLGTAKLQRLATTAGPGAIIYGAPEAEVASKHSPKMDVYSFGVLVVETMTSTLPIENLDVLKDQVYKQFPWYHQLVTSCTNQQSSDRPTMYDVIKELDKIKKIAKR